MDATGVNPAARTASAASVENPDRQPWEHDLLQLVVELGQRGGDLQSVTLGGVRHHVVTSAAGARHVLVDARERYATMPFPLASLAPALTDPGRALLRLRPAAAEARRPSPPLAELIDTGTRELVSRCTDAAAAGDSIDCVPFFKEVMLGLMTRVLFGIRPPADRVADAARAMAWLERYRVYQMPPGGLPAASAQGRRMQAMFTLEYDYARGLLVEAGVPRIDPERAPPWFDDLRAWTAQDHMVQAVARLLMNSYNGPAVALSWLMWRLVRHPETREKIVAEAGSGTPAYETAASLTFTRQVVQETLRLHPPAWALGREVLAADAIGATPLARGEAVTVSPYLLHRDPRYWDEPEAFRPDRFTAGGPTVDAGVYLPFGLGPTGCPAGSFAVRELQFVVARLATAFDWELVSSTEVRPWALISLHPDPGVTIRLHPRRNCDR